MKSLINKWNNKLVKTSCVLAAAALLSPAAFAGTMTSKTVEPVAPVEEDPFVTGTLSFIADTHFISYGFDVWGGGNDFDDVLFHPSLELVFNLGGGLSAIIGTWWDVNDKAESSIGSNVQEIDVWAGLSYATGPVTFTLLYQEWIYAGDAERIVDFKVAFDHFLAPSILVHGRVDNGLGLDNGVVGVLGIAPSIEAGPVTISFPITAAAATEDFHGGDAGFAYASAGVAASIPLVEHVNLSLGVTGYYTNDSVIPTNPDDAFITGFAGIVVTF
ncbi:hypothetical protein [Phragmitibacter flavus]|uniref:hypothetical protein n=1 Tax=Phragmitibacter flavus TaxID=2576071 RepID=UPI00140D0845|nr:hypothetical protein [Phragmitibacter flavus]